MGYTLEEISTVLRWMAAVRRAEIMRSEDPRVPTPEGIPVDMKVAANVFQAGIVWALEFPEEASDFLGANMERAARALNSTPEEMADRFRQGTVVLLREMLETCRAVGSPPADPEVESWHRAASVPAKPPLYTPNRAERRRDMHS